MKKILFSIIFIVSTCVLFAQKEEHKSSVPSTKEIAEWARKNKGSVSQDSFMKFIGFRPENQGKDTLRKDTIMRSQIPGVMVLGKFDGMKATIRWAPSDHIAWAYLNRYGYRIERMTLMRDTFMVEKDSFLVLTPKPIKPFLEEQWKSVCERTGNIGAIAAQTLLGKPYVNDISSLARIQNRFDEEVNRWSFALFCADLNGEVAEAEGLRFIDKTVKKGETYIYRIIPLVPENIYRVDIGMGLVNCQKVDKISAPPTLKSIGSEHSVLLSWELKSDFTAYWLEKSVDGTTFSPLNEWPIVHIQDDIDKAIREKSNLFMDTLKANYVPFYYRLKAINAFGEETVWSEPIKCMGRDLTPPAAPDLMKVELVQGDTFRLKWVKPFIESDFVGYKVEYCNTYDGIYTEKKEVKIAPNQTEVIVRGGFYESNWFRLVVTDTSGNRAQSNAGEGIVIDTVPPLIPKGFVGGVSKKGVVTLHWPVGAEPDLKGYRIYFSNNIGQMFINLSPKPLQDTIFTDTIPLNVLNKKIYYKICAVDLHFNHSELSEALELQRPDTIRPVTPLFDDVLVTDSVVYLKWILSSSDDIARQTLYKRQEDRNWEKVNDFDAKTKRYIATDLIPKVNYDFTIEAADFVGNISGRAVPVRVRVFDSGIRPDLKNFQAIYDKEKKTVKLTWDKPKKLQPKYLVIYRSINNGQLTAMKSIKGDAINYSEMLIDGKGVYNYSVKAVYEDGGESPLTALVAVQSE
jgi:uncharacterized protein